MTRRMAREQAFLLIFQAEFRREEGASQVFEIAQQQCEEGQEYNDYTRNVYFGVWEKVEELDALIAAHAHGWKLSRLSKTSLSLLRMAIYEMLYVEDAPYHVAINEALELAKQYEEEKAVKFLNGILNAVATDCGLKQTQQKPDETV